MSQMLQYEVFAPEKLYTVDDFIDSDAYTKSG